MQSESTRDGRALRETAKLAGPVSAPKVAKPNADSSGLVDLAALMAEQPDWLDEALAKAKGAKTVLPPPSMHAIAPLSLGPMAVEIMAESPTRTMAPTRRKPMALILATACAGALVAGACVFALHVAKPASAATTPRAAAVAALQAPSASAAPEEAALPGAPAQTAAPIVQQTASAPDDSESASADKDTAPGGGRHHHRALHEASHAAAFVAKADPKPMAAPALPPAPSPGKKLVAAGECSEAALRSAAGPLAAAPAPAPAAEAAPAAAPRAAQPAPIAGRPDHPSGSAVTSTLSEVLPRCALSDRLRISSRASVTFGSEGNVQSVNVTGPAASDPGAVKCMKAAFAKARVPPFSDPSYSAGVTVRPR